MPGQETKAEDPEAVRLKKIQKKKERRQRKKDGKKVLSVSSTPAPAPASTLEEQTEPEIVFIQPKDSDVEAAVQTSVEFKQIFEKFLTPQQMAERKDEEDEEDEENKQEAEQGDKKSGQASVAKPAPSDGVKKLSKKERKRKNRIDIADLKQSTSRPDVVELHDPNSAEPKLLVHLKAYRNTVPVPKHWCMKRKYLQGKRGIEKAPFTLPKFIADTGIMEIRGAIQDKDNKTSSKQKAREKTQVKLGKMDINYQTLHDAFFRFQTKPYMTNHGQVYYEGKEFEVKLKEKRPGHLSDELKNALGMHDDKQPPPWLLHMQRYGPPPSYPYLKVPGVNAPIPEGCRWGFGDGEWGQAPLDAYGRPLYGDVYGREKKLDEEEEKPETQLWGLLAPEVEEQEEESDEEKDVKEGEGEGEGEGAEAPSEAAEGGMDSVVSMSGSGSVTPAAIPLRKSDGTGTETPDAPRQLYTILEEKKASVGGSTFGSAHTYVIPPAGTDKKKEAKAGGVALALAPEELETLDASTLKRKYEQTLQAEKAAQQAEKADVDEVFEEESRKKKRKLEKDSKKKGSFKF